MAKIIAKDQSMFGSDFKYVLILTILAWMTYTLPSVRAAFETAYDEPSLELAAASTSTHMFGDMKLVQKNIEARRLLAEKAKNGLASSTDMGGRGEGENDRPGISPQQVVTLLFGLGIIPQDKLDAARKAVAEANHGVPFPPRDIPCKPDGRATTSLTVSTQVPCRPVGLQNKPPRLGSSTRPALRSDTDAWSLPSTQQDRSLDSRPPVPVQ